MKRTMLAQLAQPQAAAVSILCPLDARRPGNMHDPIVLRQLRDRAAESLDRHDPSLTGRLDDALATVDLQHPTDAVAVFVSPETSRVIQLHVPVEPTVTVGDRFAIGDLLAATSQLTPARALVLSQRRSRCIDIDGAGAGAVERLDFGFPVTVEPPTEADTPHRDFPLDEHEHAEATLFVLRAVDGAFRALEAHDARPVVLLGAERDLAYFDQVADHRHVVGRLPGNYEHATPDEIAHLVHPILDTHAHLTQQRACEEAREAIGRNGVKGIADVWHAARAGRGRRIVVEAGYRYRARILGDLLVPATEDDAFVVDAVNDAVAEVIRHDGEVVVVETDALADLEHIVLISRY